MYNILISTVGFFILTEIEYGKNYIVHITRSIDTRCSFLLFNRSYTYYILKYIYMYFPSIWTDGDRVEDRVVGIPL